MTSWKMSRHMRAWGPWAIGRWQSCQGIHPIVMRLLGMSSPPCERNVTWCRAGSSTYCPQTRQQCPSRSSTKSRTSPETSPSFSSSISERAFRSMFNTLQEEV